MNLEEGEGWGVLALFLLAGYFIYKTVNKVGSGISAVGSGVGSVASTVGNAYASIPAGGNNPPGQTVGNWWSNMFASGFTNSQQPTNPPDVVMAVDKSRASAADLTTGSVTTGTITGDVTTPSFSLFGMASDWGTPQSNGGAGGSW